MMGVNELMGAAEIDFPATKQSAKKLNDVT